MENSEVDLGFAERNVSMFDLTALHFPSKLGGRPAWLRWDQLPSQQTIQCESCRKQLIFLCQIYVPIEKIDNNNSLPYHKMLYLFCCLNGNCYKGTSNCVKAFRSVKIESNSDISDEDLKLKTDQELSEMLKTIESKQPLCNVCGCFGDKKCSSCHLVSYCSKDHQEFDWKKAGHSKLCKGKNGTKRSTKSKLVFDEYEIVIEAEPSIQDNDEQNREEKAKYEEYLKNMKEKGGSIDKGLEKEFSKMTKSTVDDYFMAFKEQMRREPEQIIRYNLSGDPLWVSSENILLKQDIPACTCGAERQFEFQVLPQMLNYLGIETTIDSIDWGTLCVYTCVDNCVQKDVAYIEEFLWKQDFSATDIS